MYGSIIEDGLNQLIKQLDGKFQPHSIHGAFQQPSKSVEWEIDNISDGNNFVNRSLIGSNDGINTVFLNFSFTAKNSFQKLMERYETYQKLIAERRKVGKTEEDDDDDDIRRVEVPFKFQVPFPKVDGIDKTLVIKDGIDFKGNLDIDLTKDIYNNPIIFFCKLEKIPDNKFSTICRLSDCLNSLNFIQPCDFQVQERIIYFHDDDFNEKDFVTVQMKVLSIVDDILLIELELFSVNGVQFSTIYQESLIIPKTTSHL